MRIYGAIGTIVGDVVKHKAGMSFSVGLGRESGFCKIVWFQKVNFPFDLKKGDSILIPSGNLRVSTYTMNDGREMKTTQIETNYVELFSYPTTTKKAQDALLQAKQTLAKVEEKEEMLSQFEEQQENATRMDPIFAITPTNEEIEVSPEIIKKAEEAFGNENKTEEIEWDE